MFECKNTLNYLKKLDKIHPYPAKFTIELALNYLQKYVSEKSTILDPFCGSGTTLLAAKSLNKKAFGFDINPIAHLITQAKLLNLYDDDFAKLETFKIQKNSFKHYYESIHHWFKDESIVALSNIKTSIEKFSTENAKYKVFLDLVFSSIINVASNQESDTRYASVDKKYLNEEYIYRKFLEKLHLSIEIFSHLNFEKKDFQQSFLCNAKQLSKQLTKDSISMILTSPPYPNTYDYYLYHKHRMLWLGYDVKFSMYNEIGSRREYSSLKLPKDKFNSDLLEIFIQCQKVLKHKGYIVLIMGDGKIQGEIYSAKNEMLILANKLDWHLIDYSYNELDMTSRSFMQSYRTKNKKEHILVFQKG